ncbi:hypothetical protein GGQ80_003309 [Sphingomonas jinjuensis]|uniref:Uncharacterized protein n=1 Tax=Sphingomonas jinjuensis TaxID=535907 RepID=A0A840FCN3_9SPHN|nr:hypothetical protein [Sphingomonas jinjuensis]MBB4155389.1 hypothetical protein [Sphingomonas jinjuensis]
MINVAITDAAPLLASALRRSAIAAGISIDIVQAIERPWASLTFSGTRHCLTLTMESGKHADEWLAAIESAALLMRGHVAGEPALVARRQLADLIEATIEVVTIEDG